MLDVLYGTLRVPHCGPLRQSHSDSLRGRVSITPRHAMGKKVGFCRGRSILSTRKGRHAAEGMHACMIDGRWPCPCCAPSSFGSLLCRFPSSTAALRRPMDGRSRQSASAMISTARARASTTDLRPLRPLTPCQLAKAVVLLTHTRGAFPCSDSALSTCVRPALCV